MLRRTPGGVDRNNKEFSVKTINIIDFLRPGFYNSVNEIW
jgi:hypothetical protein